MKLKVPKLFSQRNSSWSLILLGYNTSTYTIGTDGCLITSFGMYVDKTPDVVNTLLKQNGGYATGGGLFIWSKSTVLGLTQIYQSPYYSDAVTSQGLSKMRSLLDEGRPLICHVDFNPGTPKDDMHWVIVHGYDDNDVFYMQDPWSGTQTTLDVYGGVKRAVLEWRAYDKVLPKDTGAPDNSIQKDLDTCRIDRDTNHNDRMALYEELGFTGVFNQTVAVEKIRQLLALEKQFVEKDGQLVTAKSQISALEVRIIELTTKNEELLVLQNKLSDKTALQQKTIEEQGVEIQSLSGDITELKKAITTKVYSGWKKALIALIDRF